MSLKELYALTVVLMCNDHPLEPLGGVPARTALVELADKEAQKNGFHNWVDYYAHTDVSILS